MAALSEVPFGRYYGGADTTPLFVLLAGEYLKRTNDVEFCRKVWPAVRAALEWIDNFGDSDGDGFVEYSRGAAGGLQNQGWKDSDASIFHADGSLARGPIAVIEVQAYVVAAKRAAARLADVVGETDLAARLAVQADRLQVKIDAHFWSESLGTYALALDGDKRPCAVRSSNAAHVLFCGAADPEKAVRVGHDLMRRDLFSGWGVRTIARDASLYNPMSYHNGTIWPHDCSIVAAGLARYGMSEAAGRIFTGLFDAACHFPHFRLPELFCGFPRHAGEGPVAYPSACTPQAWASGAVFLLLQASLGIDIDAEKGFVGVRGAYLPEWLDRISVKNLLIGGGRATVHFRRGTDGVEVGLSDVDGNIRLLM
jgi:glycogen debranching enzyme